MIGTYIIICDIAGYISGAPIYYRNKAIYLESQGWDVRIVASNTGRVYIEGLERFSIGAFDFLRTDPAILTFKQRSRHVDELVLALDRNINSPVVVETGTDWTAYWGETLAQRLEARHFVFFLDEDNKRAKNRLEFFDYKRRRGELACITKQTMINLFSGYVDLDLNSAVGFRACCTNSIQDVEDDFSRGIVQASFNIGSIGRLDKDFVPGLVEDIGSFAQNHPDLDIQVVFFGGADSVVEERVASNLAKNNNVKVVISGYMWPFAKSAIEKMDVFASAAGSRILSSSFGIPTVAMDVCGNGAIGFVGDAEVAENPLYRVSGNENDLHASSYFEKVLHGELCKKKIEPDLNAQWDAFCEQYQEQLDSALCCKSSLEYFDISKLPVSRKDAVKRALNSIIGESATNRLIGALKASIGTRR